VDDVDGQHFFSKGNLHASKAFFLALGGIPDARIGGDHTRIDLEVCLTPDKGVGCGFPDIGCKRSGILVSQFNLALGGLGFDGG